MEALEYLRSLPKEQLEKAGIISDSKPQAEVKKFNRTDLGNAERLVYRHGKNIRYCHPFGRWYVWDGKRWCEDDTGEIERLAKGVVKSIYSEAAAEENDDARRSISTWARASEGNGRINSMISLTKSEEGIPITPNQLDANHWKLNCANGMIDLKTGKISLHDRKDLITKIVDVEYDQNADCPTWKAFLNRIMQDEKGNVRTDLIQFLQKAIGYSLTGDISEQCLFFLYGSGRNGKSTFVNVIKEILGDYAKQTSTDTFTFKQQQGPSNDIARLKGARMVAATESEEGKRLAESLIKTVTGGESITARFLYKETFEFIPTFKILFVTNHMPDIRGSDDGIWRRIRLIPFTVTIPEDEVDRELPEKLKNEYPGILRWAVEGCLLWQKEGLGKPKEVSEATNQFRQDMDILAEFIEDCCVIDENARISTNTLYKSYARWCEENGEYALNKRTFINRVKDSMDSQGLKFEPVRIGHSGGRGWQGIGERYNY